MDRSNSEDLRRMAATRCKEKIADGCGGLMQLLVPAA